MHKWKTSSRPRPVTSHKLISPRLKSGITFKFNGTNGKEQATRKRLNDVAANKLSVLQELQADCLADVRIYHTKHSRQWFESGDTEKALHVASAISDDTLQKQSQGYVRPDSFTHGCAEQRVRWFKTGFESGDMKNCNTFGILTPLTWNSFLVSKKCQI
jgi:predicted metalloprotease